MLYRKIPNFVYQNNVLTPSYHQFSAIPSGMFDSDHEPLLHLYDAKERRESLITRKNYQSLGETSAFDDFLTQAEPNGESFQVPARFKGHPFVRGQLVFVRWSLADKGVHWDELTPRDAVTPVLGVYMHDYGTSMTERFYGADETMTSGVVVFTQHADVDAREMIVPHLYIEPAYGTVILDEAQVCVLVDINHADMQDDEPVKPTRSSPHATDEGVSTLTERLARAVEKAEETPVNPFAREDESDAPADATPRDETVTPPVAHPTTDMADTFQSLVDEHLEDQKEETDAPVNVSTSISDRMFRRRGNPPKRKGN